MSKTFINRRARISPATIFGILVLASFVMMVAERAGIVSSLKVSFRGDLERETRWLAQYGQGACTLTAAALVWRLDVRRRPAAVLLLIAVLTASLTSTGIKHLAGRVRPGYPDAGLFLGPAWRPASSRESFPSGHSAAAIALTVVLSQLYPRGGVIFWTLGLMCALMRYLVDAHWPSDVLIGIAIGYGAAHLLVYIFRQAGTPGLAR
jgi:undecaprenyl-diphosphatase